MTSYRVRDVYALLRDPDYRRTVGRPVILGRLNGRVERRGKITKDVLGRYGKIRRNNNGYRRMDFCTQNKFIVMNS